MIHEIAPKTIYLGGGTPSLLSAELLGRLLDGMRDAFDTSSTLEWSMEANPRTFDGAKAKAFAGMGISRVSLGIQSWHPDVLKTLGRDHSPDEATQAFDCLREAGIPSLNIDLMFSIPGQTQEIWEDTLARTIALNPDHVSAYNLTYEEDTEFLERLRSGDFSEDEEIDADHFTTAIERLKSAGYEHYEISNYGKSEHQSLHNQAYWACRDYLGLGPGAVSTIGGLRTNNLRDTAAYVKGWSAGQDPGNQGTERLGETERSIERIALGLRRAQGLALDILPPEALIELVDAQYLELTEDDRARLTASGKLVADGVIGHLVDALS